MSYPPGSHLKQADDVSSVLSLKYEGILSYIYLAFLLVALSQLLFHIVLKTILNISSGEMVIIPRQLRAVIFIFSAHTCYVELLDRGTQDDI